MDKGSGQDADRQAGGRTAVHPPSGDHRGSGLDGFTRSEARRLVFARWLYCQGVLTEWPDLLLDRRRAGCHGPAVTDPAR